MPIQVKCSSAACGKVLNLKDELAGKAIRCPACQSVVRVPGGAAPAPKPAAAAPKPVAVAPKPVAAAPTAAAPKAAVATKPAAAAVQAAPRPAAKAAPAAKSPAPPPQQVQAHKPAPVPAKGITAQPPPEEIPELESADSSDTLWEDCAMLRHRRFMVKPKMFSFLARLWYISNPDTKEQLGLAKERFNILKLLFAVFRRWLPTWVDVREAEDSPVLFSLCQQPRLLPILPITINVYDQDRKFIGHFKTKIFSLLGGFWVHDSAGERVAEVKGKIALTAAPRIQFLDTEGRELALISSEVWEAMAQRKIKIVWGEAGFTITLAEEVHHDIGLKVLLLASAVALDLTGIMKAFKR